MERIFASCPTHRSGTSSHILLPQTSLSSSYQSNFFPSPRIQPNHWPQSISIQRASGHMSFQGTCLAEYHTTVTFQELQTLLPTASWCWGYHRTQHGQALLTYRRQSCSSGHWSLAASRCSWKLMQDNWLTYFPLMLQFKDHSALTESQL